MQDLIQIPQVPKPAMVFICPAASLLPGAEGQWERGTRGSFRVTAMGVHSSQLLRDFSPPGALGPLGPFWTWLPEKPSGCGGGLRSKEGPTSRIPGCGTSILSMKSELKTASPPLNPPTQPFPRVLLASFFFFRAMSAAYEVFRLGVQ